MRRLIAMLLLLCMLLPLGACTGNGGTTPGGGGAGKPDAGSETVWQDTLGEMDFGGEEVAVSVVDIHEYELFGAENSEDTLDQLLFQRNTALRDRFNVELVSVPTQTTGPYDMESHFNEVQRALARNEADFDFIAMLAWQSGKLITSGYYLDWRSEVPYCGDSIKAGNAWWPKGINDDSTVCGHQYVAVSDISISAIEMAWAIVFNKELVTDHNIARKMGNYDTMYAVVDDGAWTLEAMNTALKDFYIDQGAEGEDEDDVYGMLMQGTTGVDAFAFSFGYHYVINDAVNAPELWSVTLSVVTALETLRAFTASRGCHYTYGLGYTDADHRTFFADGHALFATHPLEYLKSDTIHEMEAAYGVLPYPKLNTSQKSYLTGTVDHYSVLSIPFTNFNLERTGAVVEALSAYNNLNVNDRYYESIITHKNTRDPDSVRMIDIIMDGRVYDLTTYHYNDLVVNKNHGDGALGLFFRYLIKNSHVDISAYWQSCQNYLPDDMDRLISDYESIAAMGG